MREPKMTHDNIFISAFFSSFGTTKQLGSNNPSIPKECFSFMENLN